MAVEKNMWGVARLGLGGAHHHRAARRLDAGDIEAELPEFADEPVRRAVAVGKMGGDRRNRRNFEQREQTIQRGALVGVDGREHVFELGHGISGAPRSAPTTLPPYSSRRAPRVQLGSGDARARPAGSKLYFQAFPNIGPS